MTPTTCRDLAQFGLPLVTPEDPIHQLINTDGAELLGWFERIAESSPTRLHRP
jgi:hypothetical protein